MLPTHSPVRLIFGSKPRGDGVRCIKAAAAHAVDLPAGPVNKCTSTVRAEDTGGQLGTDYAGCINLIEEELISIAGLEGE